MGRVPFSYTVLKKVIIPSRSLYKCWFISSFIPMVSMITNRVYLLPANGGKDMKNTGPICHSVEQRYWEYTKWNSGKHPTGALNRGQIFQHVFPWTPLPHSALHAKPLGVGRNLAVQHPSCATDKASWCLKAALCITSSISFTALKAV